MMQRPRSRPASPLMPDFAPLTSATIIGSMAVVPAYLYATYAAAGSSRRKRLGLTAGVLVYGFLTTLFVVEAQFWFDGPYVVPAVMLTSLAVPTVLVLLWPRFFVPDSIGLAWLVGVQAFRVIGGLYLLEYSRGNVGPEFAYWAGIGDVVTGIAAGMILLRFWRRGRMSHRAVLGMILFGLADFAWAYTIGVLSFETPIQVFSTDDLHATAAA